MARQNIDIGVQGNDGTGDSVRESFKKVNENFTQLFAIFGAGDTISFKDLGDTPKNWPSGTADADQVIVSNSEGTALVNKNLVGGEGIFVDHSDENQIRVISTGGKVANDPTPSLGNHLNAQGFTIGKLAEPSDEVAARFNSVHNTAITTDDLALTQGFADKRYIQAGGGSSGGATIRIHSEPENTTAYTRLISAWNNGYAQIPDHGLNSGANGIAFKYYKTGTTPASGLTAGETYYLRYADPNRLSVHATRTDATSGLNRIIVNDPEISDILRGTETFVDAYYQPIDNDGYTLDGNWLSNEALPRVSVVRRQGDHMSGTLYLNDHPGSLAGAGTPQGADDLQAATKFYVDNSSFASQVNLFVQTNGDDTQAQTPVGKEGRAFAYAYETISAACQKAEALINNSLTEPGPYRQLLTYGDKNNISYLSSFSTQTGLNRTLEVFTNGLGVDQSKVITNRDLQEGDIIRGLRSGATGLVTRYIAPTSLDDGYEIRLLRFISDETVFQTDFKYAARQLTANKEFIAVNVNAFIKAKYPSLDYNQSKSLRDVRDWVDAMAYDLTYGGNIKTVRGAKTFWKGVTSVLNPIEKAPCIEGMAYINLLAQQIITNTLIPDAVDDTSFGNRSVTVEQDVVGVAGEDGSDVAIERLVSSLVNIVENGLTGDGTPLEFIPGEQLEFGQKVPQLQITILVETGIYYEQLPIRIPANVSLIGDDMRRVIVRPAPGISLSPWAGLYFYRDTEFDGLTRTWTSDPLCASSSGTTITLSSGDLTASAIAVGMNLLVTAGTGTFDSGTTITEILSTTSFKVSRTPITPLVNATVRGLNQSGLAPTGQNFGYHYLTDPSGVSGIFSDTPASGSVNAAALLTSNRSFIQEEVVQYLDDKYPNWYNGDTTLRTLARRDSGYLVDAIVYDIIHGGTTRSLYAGEAYNANESGRRTITTFLVETLDSMSYIDLLAQQIITKTTIPAAPDNVSFGKRGAIAQSTTGTAGEAGSGDDITVLINGIKNIAVGTTNPPKQNKDMDLFLMNDGTRLRNMTCQGHGGFMCVFDPEGQILTKSPYVQTATSLSGSINKQRFAGGMYIDGFNGNLPARITGRNGATEITVDSLLVRAPLIPTYFYVGGGRYQLNEVMDYSRPDGTATLTLASDTTWPINDPDTGLPWVYPIDIVIQTPGHRMMLASDFTQINDLGYGIVSTNNAWTEQVSVFTYYNWTSFFSNNGANIRSVGGSTCNGRFGLKSAGRDPNEVPDDVVLADNMIHDVRVYKRGEFAGGSIIGDQSIYIDWYEYASGTTQPAIYNVSQLEVDHTNSKSSVLPNTALITTNVTITAGGANYAVGDTFIADGGTLFTGGLPTKFRVKAISGGGATGPVTEIDIIEVGTYSINPFYPLFSGELTTTAVIGSGSNCKITCTYQGDIEIYEISNIEVTTVAGSGVNPGGSSASRNVVKLNLSTAGGQQGLKASLEDGQIITIRALQNFRYTGIANITPSRPFTALAYSNAAEDITYRTLNYQLTYPSGYTLLQNKTVSAISRDDGVATITTSTAHGLSSGSRASIVVTSNNSFNATAVVVTVVDLYNFTYINSGINVALGTLASGTLTYGDQAILTFDSSYDHIVLQAEALSLAGGYGSTAGDTKIAVAEINDVSIIDRLNSGDKIFTWKGRMHRITSYTPAAGLLPNYISFTDVAYGNGTILSSGSGLAQGFTTARNTNFRASLPAGTTAKITVNISTTRVSSHDFLDIGTGGYNDTNFPTNIFGSPVTAPGGYSVEVVEAGEGRVFHTSTDQNGVFRVGKFFTVDQGSGTVTFAASIALSNLDGIGFKRGVVVKEFSTDNTMAAAADDAVPTQSAVIGYINKRLGYDQTGTLVASSSTIPVNFGYLPTSESATGSIPTLNADLSMGSTIGHRIINLVPNTSSATDAATIGYVNTQVALYDTFTELKEVNVMTPTSGDLVAFTGAGKSVISTSIGGDITATLTSTALAVLVGGRTAPGVADDGIIGTTGSSVADGIEVDDASDFVNPGGSYTAYLQIGNEIFGYTEITGNVFNDITRAKFLTTGATHASGLTVKGLDSSQLNLQINADTIVNADINSAAAIEQSKLAMTIATTRASAPTGTTADKQAASGLASFDSSNFEITDGFVGIKAGGVAYSELANIADGSVLGNFTGSATYPREVTTSGIVQNGIDNLFADFDTGANVMTRRYDSLKTTSTFVINTGVAISGAGAIINVPVNNISGSGNGALVTVNYAGNEYTGITVTFGGQGYAEGDELIISGALLGGSDGVNDVNFTIETTGDNIDTTVYLGLTKVSVSAEANSIVRTDYLGNLGDKANQFNNVYSTTFTGALVGNASTATKANYLLGGVTGAVPYQSAIDTTILLSPGTPGYYLKTQGAGSPPVWAPVADGSAGSLTGTTLNSTIIYSSLKKVGDILQFGVNNSVTAAGFTQAGATLLGHTINIVTTVDPGTGVRLPEALIGYRVIIRNNSSNDLLVYPGLGARIGSGVVDDPITLQPETALEYFCTVSAISGTGGTWYNLNTTFA